MCHRLQRTSKQAFLFLLGVQEIKARALQLQVNTPTTKLDLFRELPDPAVSYIAFPPFRRSVLKTESLSEDRRLSVRACLGLPSPVLSMWPGQAAAVTFILAPWPLTGVVMAVDGPPHSHPGGQ